MKRVTIFIVLVLVLIALAGIRTKKLHEGSVGQNQQSINQSVQIFDKNQYSLTKPDSIWVIINKSRKLPDGYIPDDLVVPDVSLRISALADEMHISQKASNAIEDMFVAAKKQGKHLMLASGFRSQITQAGLFNSYAATIGQKEAERSSAKPGHSEHQTGLAADVEPTSRECEIQTCFARTAEGKWLAANAYKYGFIIRYPEGKESITGYKYEPWHIRYVGKGLAAEMKKAKISTLEEFFSVKS